MNFTVIGLLSALALLLSGCSNSRSGSLEKETTLGYKQHRGLDCNHGHGSDPVEYVLKDISMQQCLDACTRERQCDGVVIQGDQNKSNHTCWLHRQVDMSNCIASSDHDLWLRTAVAVAATDNTVPAVVPFTVGFDENCWLPCGEKYGYCAACSTQENPWGACCMLGATDGVCARATLYISPEPRCVKIPAEQFPGGVLWMKNFSATFFHVNTQSDNGVGYTLHPTVCNPLGVDRISVQSPFDDVVILSLGGLNIQCEQPVELSFFGSNLPLKVRTSMKAATLDARFQLPSTHRDNSNITMETCELHCDLEIDFEITSKWFSWLESALEWLAGFTKSRLKDEIQQKACAREEAILEDEIQPKFRNLMVYHHPKVLDDSVDLDCYSACGNKAGWCPACGPGRACCRAGHDSHLEECSAIQLMDPESAYVDFGRHECVQVASRPWLPSLVYRHDDINLNFTWGIGVTIQRLSCGGVHIKNMLMDITSSGLSGHITGMDFAIECTAEIRMLGQTAFLHARLRPGFHGMIDMHTKEHDRHGIPNVTDCRVNLPFKVTITGHWASWPLNGLVAFLQWALQEKIQKTACQHVKNTVETTMWRIAFSRIRPHWFLLD